MKVEVASFKGSRSLEILLVSVTVDVNNTELELDVLHFTSAGCHGHGLLIGHSRLVSNYSVGFCMGKSIILLQHY